MEISPDNLICWSYGPVTLNATIVFTWLVMGIMTLCSWLVTRNLSTEVCIPPWQNFLESIVEGIHRQLREILGYEIRGLYSFLTTLFLFIAVSNLLGAVPGFQSPTGSLSTTIALAVCVLLATPLYGIARVGFFPYFLNYMRPTPIMLPFNIMGELSRTMALAVRLFGNVMSGSMISAVLLIVIPLIFPVLLQLLGLLTGMIQAYIFTVLAAIYIRAGMEVEQKRKTF
ncbi:MAG: F0F1 ATP synthase subunit A [Desulfobacterales bacterium]